MIDLTTMPESGKNDNHYVGRGALKLKYALERFNVDVKGAVAADLGEASRGWHNGSYAGEERESMYAVGTKGEVVIEE